MSGTDVRTLKGPPLKLELSSPPFHASWLRFTMFFFALRRVQDPALPPAPLFPLRGVLPPFGSIGHQINRVLDMHLHAIELELELDLKCMISLSEVDSCAPLTDAGVQCFTN